VCVCVCVCERERERERESIWAAGMAGRNRNKGMRCTGHEGEKILHIEKDCFLDVGPLARVDF
jgi:hypothetical protein